MQNFLQTYFQRTPLYLLQRCGIIIDSHENNNQITHNAVCRILNNARELRESLAITSRKGNTILLIYNPCPIKPTEPLSPTEPYSISLSRPLTTAE